MHKKAITTVVAVALLLTGCAADGASNSEHSQSAQPAASSTASSTELPETPGGQKMAWLLDLVNSGTEVTAEQFDSEMSDDLKTKVSAADLAKLINEQFIPAGPFTVRDFQEDGRDVVAVFDGAKGDSISVYLVVDDAGKLGGIKFGPEQQHEAAATLEEVQQRLDALNVNADLSVRVDGEEIVQGAADPKPIGSIFKLWVLKALVGAIDRGELKWDDELTVTPEVKSLPSGQLQDKPDGTKVTVQEAAQLMIEISDNTATDMLIQAIGQDKVNEAAPESMRPLLTTKETFSNLGVNSLDDADPTDSWADEKTWAASPEMIATVYDELTELAKKHPEVDEILSANPGVPAESYDSLWFKGGSLAGVLAGSWRGVLPDGRVVTVVLRASSDNPQTVADATNEALMLAGDALEITARTS